MPLSQPQNPFLSIPSSELCSEEFARKQDKKDNLSRLRKEFIIPTKADLRNKRYGPASTEALNTSTRSDDAEESIYMCGNSLGLQPQRTREYVNRYLDTWASKGVFGHFKELEGGLPPWLHIDDALKEQMSRIVGALQSEVAVMETLTANLHLLMSSFYKPTKERYKIIIEGKAFPSDHYAVLSQLALHSFPPSALITIDPPSPSDPYLSTEHILSVISEHAATTGLVLLPGIQFYSGQFFDIELITRHCHSLGVTIGWDLAHAVGNVPLKLHDWNVDFAVWCNYKYMNGGPGVIGGLFVHHNHGQVWTERQNDDPASAVAASSSGKKEAAPNGDAPHNKNTQIAFQPRLSGWWGSDKNSRFLMNNKFVPIPGASGFQLSNPSALDMTSVLASLDVFSLVTMTDLRERSVNLTAYLEARLLHYDGSTKPPYKIITPSNAAERGAQLSVLLNPGMLDHVLEVLEEGGVVVDERKPDVIRVAPAPLYNSFWDVHRFMEVFLPACKDALALPDRKKAGNRKPVEDARPHV
ncbi:kynureninase [Pleomassaria siparia CBS 279.74]|uniref:Kynureninase n=1 Tax=Pleomassaria siparia CBS 279.74 TaxID=1314801 RepID=A0A6G1KGX0_9PLEO|nr:kynureninase [Pleomassaria siparia CBS 279.74]